MSDIYVEDVKTTDASQLIHLSADQTWAFEQGLKAGKCMAEDKDKKNQIEAIKGVQRELHELNKTLKQIAGRLK